MTRLSSVVVAGAAALACIVAVEGFTVTIPQRSLLSVLRMSDDEFPSDTSSDGVVTVESEPFEPTESEALVTSIMDQLPGIGEVSAETRATINEALLKLEAMNPTDDPANSPLVNGVWELRYAAGYTAEWTLPSPTRYDQHFNQEKRRCLLA